MSKWLKCAMVACTLAVTAATTVPAAADTFIKLADYKGDATFKGHEGEVNVLSWGWSASQARSSGAAAGRATVSDLTITKNVDGTTPLLVEALLTGKVLPNATLTVVNTAGDRGATSIRITLSNVFVSGVTVSPSTTSGGTPVEQISLSFGAIEYAVTPSRGATVTYKYDARAGR